MYPIVCQLGPVPVYSYGLMLAIAVMMTSFLISRDAHKMGVSSDMVYDLAFWVVLAGIVGARIFYIFLNLDFFLSQPFEMIMVQKGGLAWQGSLVFGFVTAVMYLRKKRVPFWKFLDVAAPYVALGHAIGRIGCLLNGCCYGKPAGWGIFFPVFGERLQPTQIYMSLGQLAIFFILRASQSRLRKDGQVFVLYLLLSAVERFLVEFVRADHVLYGGLSIFQYVCIGIIVLGLIIHLRLAR
ncbi:MAG: prolipoprotein diacylglyceryl transferase [Candidatus Omnitrophica bacterium]|nr:prolipoprotein diacylglyceryl transferase [Candidatus Omnitrophota bacterium]